MIGVLGIMIGNNLTWSQYVDNKVCKKITTNVWLLSRIKEYLTMPYIDYCNDVWGGTSHVNLNIIFRLQKRACKIILDYNVEKVLVNMDELKILTVYDRLYLRKAKFMQKVCQCVCPSVSYFKSVC